MNSSVAHDQKETRDSIHNAFKPLFDRCESGDCEGPDELCLHFMECARQVYFTFSFISLAQLNTITSLFITNLQFISQFTWDNEEQLGTMMDDSLSMTLKAITQTGTVYWAVIIYSVGVVGIVLTEYNMLSSSQARNSRHNKSNLIRSISSTVRNGQCSTSIEEGDNASGQECGSFLL